MGRGVEVKKDELQHFQEMVDSRCNMVVNKTVSKIEKKMKTLEKKIDTLADDISEIKDCLLGDPEYKTKGIIVEHREMYEDFKGFRWLIQHLRELVLAIIGIIVGLVGIVIKTIADSVR